MGTKTEVIGSTFNKGGPLWRLFNILLPWGFIIIAIGGFLLALRFLQFSVAMSSLLYVIPVMLAGALLLIKNNDAAWFKVRIRIKQLPFRHLGLIYILFYVVSAMFLVSSPGRPLGYFFITGFISAVVFMQIISRRAKWTDYLIILEIVALSLNITWGVVLKYPLYFGSTDTLGHLAHILSILQTSHTFNMSLSYMNFPLYHIFIAMASELSGLSAITSLFIFMGLAWQIGILACFLILRKITNSRKIALLGCLLFAVSPQIIFYGTYPITRSLAFAFFLFWLYLIINKERPVYIILSVVMMWAMIFTHHATFLYAIPVLLVIYLCQRVVRTPPRNRLPLLPVMVLFVSFFFYVFFVATVFTDMQIPAWLNSILSAETDVNNSIVTKEALQSPNNILYYSLLLIWFLVGIGYYLRSRRSMKLLGLSGIALASLVFIIFFIPGPLDLIPQSEAALSYRIPLLISPLVLLMMTFGIICLMNKESNIWRFLTGKTQIPLLTVILVGVSTYF
jgi:hypothetical protein